MKNFLFFIFIFFILFFTKNLLSLENIYETKFYDVEISNEIINDSKIREIDRIKKLSFFNLSNKILSRREYNKLEKIIKSNDEINYLIKSILIDDEFSSSNKYKAKIKVNFDTNEIVRFLRDNKINYTDLSSPKFLVLVAESTKISQTGISKDNSFYDDILPSNYNLINFIYPELSTNDRFIISYEKIINKHIESLNKISLKYEINNVLIILLKLKKNNYEIDISVYSKLDDMIINIANLDLPSDDSFIEPVFSELDNWWKENNFIDNSIINTLYCRIKSSNIKESQYINDMINSISQIKSNNLVEIKLNANTNEIVFFGNLNNLLYKLLDKKINLYFNSNKICNISINS